MESRSQLYITTNPPYNTGKDFIYKDDYKDNLVNYLAVTGQVDEEGNKINTNSDSSGRYHTNWLNMMYPRLRLARNLLKDDGVIFISIDDNEVDNLRKICNEIFGEDNSVGTITWEKRTKAQNTNDAKDMFQSKTEYILIYKKNISKIRFNLEVAGSKEYDQKDEKGIFRYKALEEMSSLGMRGRETMIYPALGIMPGENKQWKFGIDTINEYIKRQDFVLINNWPHFKIRPIDEDAKKYFPFWSHFFDKDTYGTAEVGKTELSDLLNTKSHGFETVKPLNLLKKLIFHVKDMEKDSSDGIILDFFSGSATTAHSVMSINIDEQKRQKYIMVQIPEKIDENTEVFKSGYKNICEIAKARIRRAGDKIVEENKDKEGIEDLDIGFKVLKLDTSNIKPWNPDYDNIEMTLEDTIDNFIPGRTEEDVVFEIMLKYGVDLTYPMDIKEISNKKVFSIGFGALIICLDNDIILDVVNEIVKLKEELNPATCRVVFKDNGFKTDSVKTNAVEILKRNNIEEIMSI